LATALAARRPGVDPAELVPVGISGVLATLERFLDAGCSKFVLVPAEEPDSWDDELGELAQRVLPLQSVATQPAA
jgi:hypothetical protein